MIIGILAIGLIVVACDSSDDSGDGHTSHDVDGGDGDMHVDGSDADGDGEISEVDGDGADSDADVGDGDGGPDCTAGREGIVDNFAALPDSSCHVRDLDIIGSKIYGLCDNTHLIFSANIGSDPLAPTTCSRVASMPETTPSLLGGPSLNNTPTQIMDMGGNLLLALYETDGEEDAADYFSFCTPAERTRGCEFILRDGIKIYDTTRAYGSDEFSGIGVHTIEVMGGSDPIYYSNRQPHSAVRSGSTLLVGMRNLNGEYEPGMVNNYSLLPSGAINTDRAVDIPPQLTFGRNPGAMAVLDGSRFVLVNMNGEEGSTGLLTGEDPGANIAIVDITEPLDFAVTTIPLGSSVILTDTPDLAMANVGGVNYAVVADNNSPATLYRVNLDTATDDDVDSQVMPAGGLVTSIAISAATGRIFVTLDTGYIYSGNLVTMVMGTGLYLCENPADSALHTDGQTLYVGCEHTCGETATGARIVAVNTATL